MATGGGEQSIAYCDSFGLKPTSSSSKESSATWSSPVRVAAGINHLSVELASKITPTLSAIRSEGHTTLDVETVFAQYVPHTIDLQDIVADLKTLWETQREFFAPGMLDCLVTSPIITQTGGLILQLCDRTHAESVVVQKKPVATKVYENGQVTSIRECTSSSASTMADEAFVKSQRQVGECRVAYHCCRCS